MSQSSSKYNTLAINSQNSLHQDIPQLLNFRNPFHSPNIFSFNVSNRPSENPIVSPDTKAQGLSEVSNPDSLRNQERVEPMGIKSNYTSNKSTGTSKNENNQEIENHIRNIIKTYDKENIPVSPNTFFISPSAQRRLTEEFENQAKEELILNDKSIPKATSVNNFPLIPQTNTTNDNNHIISAEFGQLKEPFGSSDKSKKTPNNRYNHTSHANEYGNDVQPFTPVNSEQTKVYDKEVREHREQVSIQERSTSRNSSRRRIKPIVVLNIDIGKGAKAELQFYENDVADEVAKKFCDNYGLPTKICKVLSKNIQAQVDTYYRMKAERAAKRQANTSRSFMEELSNCSGRDRDTASEEKNEAARNSMDDPVLEPKYEADNNSIHKHLSKLNPDDFFGHLKKETYSQAKNKPSERKGSDNEEKVTKQGNKPNTFAQSRREETVQQSIESIEKFSTNEPSESGSIVTSTQTPRNREQAAAEHYEKWTNYLSDKKNTANRKNIISKSPGNYLKRSMDKEYIISPTIQIEKQVPKRSFSSKSARTLNYSERADDSPFDVNHQFQSAKRAIFDRLYEDGLHSKKMKETMNYIKQRKRESQEMTGHNFCQKINPSAIDITRAKTLRIETDNSSAVMTSKDKKRRVNTPGASSKPNATSFTSENDDSRSNYGYVDVNDAHSRLYEDARLKNEKMKSVQADKTRFGSFKPTLCKESIKMSSRGREQAEDPIFIRLYKNGLEKKRSLSQKKENEEVLDYDEVTGQKLFQPQINKNSKYYKPDVYLQKNKAYDVNGSEPATSKRPKTPTAKKSTNTNNTGNKTPTHKIDLCKAKTTLKGIITPATVKNTLENIVPPSKNKSQINHSYTTTVSLSSKTSVKQTPKATPTPKNTKPSIKEETKTVPTIPTNKRMSEEPVISRRDPYPSKKSSAAQDVGTQLLSQIFIVLDSDGDGYISAECVDVSRLSPDILDCISDVLFDLENDLTLTFNDFVSLSGKHRVVEKLIQLYGIPIQEMESPDKAFLSTEDGEGYDSSVNLCY